MRAPSAFDEWAADGRDRDMAERHWNTAKHVLAAMPVEAGDIVLDLGCGSGYGAEALATTREVRAVGLDGSREMVHNAGRGTDHENLAFLRGDFHALPFPDDALDHCFTMEAFYYATDPAALLAELVRTVRSGGTVHCAVNYYEENVHSRGWSDALNVEMTRWSAREYRRAFRAAGFHVASQTHVPDREIHIPPASEFPYTGPVMEWETRAEMVERYRDLGTLLTVGVVP